MSRFLGSLVGQKLGRLFAVADADIRKMSGGKFMQYYRCQCDCGNEKIISRASLRFKKTKSCGCLQKEAASRSATRHGYARPGQRAPEYKIWSGIIKRCTNIAHISYRYYGGRGITICDRWRYSFPNFLTDMGPRPSSKHSVERKNNDGHYEPKNCIWATQEEQAINRRCPKYAGAYSELLRLLQQARYLYASDDAHRQFWIDVNAVLESPVNATTRRAS